MSLLKLGLTVSISCALLDKATSLERRSFRAPLDAGSAPNGSRLTSKRRCNSPQTDEESSRLLDGVVSLPVPFWISRRFHPNNRASADHAPGPTTASATPRIPRRTSNLSSEGIDRPCHAAA